MSGFVCFLTFAVESGSTRVSEASSAEEKTMASTGSVVMHDNENESGSMIFKRDTTIRKHVRSPDKERREYVNYKHSSHFKENSQNPRKYEF